jgi:hypothetical protein
MRHVLLVISIALVTFDSSTARSVLALQSKKENPPTVTTKPTDIDPGRDRELARAELRQRASELIKQAARDASSLDDRRSAAQIQTNAAEALWTSDQITARHFFQSAFDAALDSYRNEQGRLLDPTLILTGETGLDTCKDLIRRVATKDSTLAQQFTEALTDAKAKKRKSSPEQRSAKPYLTRIRETDLANPMARATSLLATNQQAAITEMKRLSSQGPLPLETVFFLWQLARQDRAAADNLLLWLLANICYDEYADAQELLSLRLFLFPAEFAWAPQGAPRDPPRIAPRNPASEELLLQWYVEASFIVLSRAAESDLSIFADAVERLRWGCYLAVWLEPKVAQARPQLLTEWRALTERLRRRLNPQQAAQVASLLERGKELNETWNVQAPKLDPTVVVQRILERAEKASRPEDRDQLFQIAALEADHIPDLTWALQIAARISEKDFRQQVEDWLYFNAATRALSQNDIAEARRYALAIKSAEESVDIFCRMVSLALKEKDQSRARDLLAEGEVQATKADDSSSKVRAFVSLAKLWASLDKTRSIEVLSTAIETANRVPEYSREQARTVRSLGKGTARRFALIRGSQRVDLGSTLAGVAEVDLDRALDLTGLIESEQLKYSVSVVVGAAVLEQTRKENAAPKRQ